MAIEGELMEEALTPREAKLVEGILDGKPTTVAAADAGYSPSYAARFNLKERTKVKNALIEAMEKQGINEDLLAKVMSDGLKAKKTIIEGRKMAEVDDHPTRHKFLETATKVHGYMKEAQTSDVNIGIIEVPLMAKSPEDWNEGQIAEGKTPA